MLGVDLREFVRVLGVVFLVERGRLTLGPARLLPLLRERGQASRSRTPEQRGRLQRMIALVDRFMPGGPNCYRRSLLEVALDSVAAREPLRLGLRKQGGPSSGHAWLPHAAGTAESYDAEFVV
ncbi:MAG: hypothetical protein JWM82_3947 [Myxococcales bacterium]|nr:hypothetical protein [Myxococcales bacterium]